MSKQELAQKLFDNDFIQKLDNETWLVKGSNNNSYEVIKTNDQSYDYYCKCVAWRMDNSRECKHVLAVLLYEKGKK